MTQTEDARFAELDRKGRINQGVKVLLNRGSEGTWVGHAWAARPVTLHSRVMLRMVSGGEGQVVFLRGLGSDGLPRFSLDANPQARQITLRLPSGDAQVADLPWAIAWHCIEVGANSNTGVLRLWINGVLRCELNTYPPELEIAELRLGGFYKDYELTGEYHLNDWRIEENYIGPVRKMVSGSALNDPARWLVVYNTSQADTCAWAEHYRELRLVPHANLCGLELSLDEVLDPQGYAEMDAAITDYLTDNGLLEQVKGLVLGLGVPGYVDFAGVLQPTTALLQRAGAVPGMVENAHLQAQGYTPLAAEEMGIDRLTARMDRHSFASAATQMDRALELSAQGLGNGDASGLWLEPATNTTAGQIEWNQRLTAWTAGQARMRTRLPWHLPAEGQQFTQLQ
ncbi:MAG: hypothetical protein HC898_12950, partial [Phycisphaerales bacterium]|nr:hypothetical protein [Phycisphaerales bacterium]